MMILSSFFAVLLLLISPLIVLTNVLIVSVWIRFKRLRTPSNLLILSLSIADLGFGLFLPISLAIDFSMIPSGPVIIAQNLSVTPLEQQLLIGVPESTNFLQNLPNVIPNGNHISDTTISKSHRPPYDLSIPSMKTGTLQHDLLMSSEEVSRIQDQISGTVDRPAKTRHTVSEHFLISPSVTPKDENYLSSTVNRISSTLENLDQLSGTVDQALDTFLVPLETYPEQLSSTPNSPIYLALPFGFLLTFCSCSLLSSCAIALDRFTSVAQPLRYNHFVTMTYVKRFIAACWIYAAMVVTIPLVFFVQDIPYRPGSIQLVVLWLTIFLYTPCATAAMLSYGYIYFVARSHARAIYSVEVSLNNCDVTETAGITHHRYGLTLAMIVGSIVTFWLPVQLCAIVDVVGGQHFLDVQHCRLIVSAPIVINSVLNPWLYGYRSAEVRIYSYTWKYHHAGKKLIFKAKFFFSD